MGSETSSVMLMINFPPSSIRSPQQPSRKFMSKALLIIFEFFIKPFNSIIYSQFVLAQVGFKPRQLGWIQTPPPAYISSPLDASNVALYTINYTLLTHSTSQFSIIIYTNWINNTCILIINLTVVFWCRLIYSGIIIFFTRLIFI